MADEELWIWLPRSITELVLSFLPLPALCRIRCVCKTWRRLSLDPWFLERNRATKPYLFVTRYLSPVGYGDVWSAVDEAHRRTCFLDLEEQRWYAIPAAPSPPTNDEVLRLLAIDNGLCVELSHLAESYKLAVRDPVARTRRDLPADGVVCPVGETDPEIDALPVVVTAVDASGFKIFLMNRDSSGLHSGFFVFESLTGAWRSLRAPPERLGSQFKPERVLEESAVFFRGEIYAVFWYNDSNTNVVVSYNPEADSWREVVLLDVENPKCPQLMAFRDRLFIAVWNVPVLRSSRVFEIREILMERNATRLVARIPSEELEKVCGEKELDFEYGFPLDSRCVLLISRRSGRVVRYELGSGAVAALLPAHPLDMSEEFALKLQQHSLFPHYRARISNLSLRNVLSSAS